MRKFLNGIAVGDTVVDRHTGNRQVVHRIDFTPKSAWPYYLDNNIWVGLDRLLPRPDMPPTPSIQEAWIVEGVTFTSRAEAEDHVLGIRLHNELKSVFSLLTHTQEAILDTLVLKLVQDSELFKEIFNGRA